MANPAPTINQINAFNATQGTTIDFNIIGGTELVRSNRIYIYDLSDNSLICTHLYVSTESIHELPSNTDGSIVYESGKSSADFVNGAQYYAQIQTFTDIAGTEGGSGLSVAKMFWCLVDPTLTITTIPSTISTTSYNVSATYNANTSVVSNIIQQYQFSLYSATGSLLQSSGVVVGNGEQQGTSTAYDISYNFTGLSVGSSYYVTIDVTTTQGMSVNVQSNTFTVSIDTPTLGEATVVNNACDGYISVTSNLSGEYGGSGSGEIVSFETDSENVFTKLQVDLEPVQDLNGYDAPWVGGAGKNKLKFENSSNSNRSSYTYTSETAQNITATKTAGGGTFVARFVANLMANTTYKFSFIANNITHIYIYSDELWGTNVGALSIDGGQRTFTPTTSGQFVIGFYGAGNVGIVQSVQNAMLMLSTETDTTYEPYSNICPISGHDEVEVGVVGVNQWDEEWELGNIYSSTGQNGDSTTAIRSTNYIPIKPNTQYYVKIPTTIGLRWYAKDKSYIEPQGVSTSGVVTTPNNAYYLRFVIGLTTYNNDISINYPSTDHDYHAYNGQSYTQEIEATYTPTVQENEPYQFKRTGDVGGDRESIELVGGSVAWNQLIQSMTSDYWRFYHANGSFSNGVCSFTATQSDWNLALKATSYPALYANHKYLFSFAIKAESNTTNVMARFSDGVWDKTVNPTTGWVEYSTIKNKSSNTAASVFYVMDKKESDYVRIDVKNFITIDLTQMFGSTIADYIYTLEQGQAGAGVAFFRKYFPLPYYPYDAGTIKSVEGVSAHKTVGFNQWDEEWRNGYFNQWGTFYSNASYMASKNYIPVVPNTTYNFHVGSKNAGRICFYDLNEECITTQVYTSSATDFTFTTPNNCYFMQFDMAGAYGNTYKNDICINLSWDGERNGEYEPYVEHSYSLDDSLTLRGIPKVANGKLYFDGDVYESSGSVTRKQKPNLTLDGSSDEAWAYNTSAGDCTLFTVTVSDSKAVTNSDTVVRCVSTRFVATTAADLIAHQDTPWMVALISSNRLIFTMPTSEAAYTDNMRSWALTHNIEITYELETPTTEQAEPFESIQKVTPNYGTEEFVTNSIVPVGNNTQYYTREIYGGYIDLVSGTLVATMGIVDLSTLPWTHITFGNNQNVWRADAISNMKTYDDNVVPPCIAEKYVANSVNNLYLNNLGIAIRTSGNRIFVANASSTSSPTGNLCYELATPQTYQLTPQQIQTLVGQNNVWSEQGDVELSYHIPITNLLVKRQDVDDVSGSWLTLYSQPVTQASDMDFTFIDFLNQYGKTYKYALVPLLNQTQSGVEVEVEGGYTVSDEVQSVFDGVFIVDSTGSQKCKANVGYGNVDMNQTVGTITPIGAKYPVVITNSQNQYHNGSISGTIVPDDYYFNGNLSRIDMVNKRDELEQFLTNKRAKIIKDWNGKIWLVMIMDNVSCTFNNNYGMGIVNFSTNWVEVGDPTNQQDLQATGLINVGGV